MNRAATWGLVVLLGSGVGCEGSIGRSDVEGQRDATGQADSGPDPSQDPAPGGRDATVVVDQGSGEDPGADAGGGSDSDAGVEGGSDAQPDAGSGSGSDAGSDAGTEGDAGSGTDAGSGMDAGTAMDAGAPGVVPAFVAVGKMGRTTMSCDDGQTWIADRSFDSAGDPLVCGQVASVRCFSSGCSYIDGGQCVSSGSCDCDHHPGSARGVVFGSGGFVATFGWGYAGQVMRSTDGIQWSVVDSGHTFSGVAYGAGTFVLTSRSPLVSTDGVNWNAGGPADFRNQSGNQVWTARTAGFLPHGTGTFLASAGSSGDHSLLTSTDGGQTWQSATYPSACLDAGVLGYAYGGGVGILANDDGDVCRTTDGGQTWTRVDVSTQFLAEPVYVNGKFMVWEWGQVHESTDGLTWTSQSTSVPGGNSFTRVAVSPVTGTFVAVRSGWQTWYGDQKFYRSSDGITWTELAGQNYTGSHPISDIAFGYVQPSASCPAP
jgi:hypothetical protein